MKFSSPASAVSIVLLLSGALLSGCAATKPLARCDTSQVVGSCAVTVEKQGARFVVCPVASAAATPVCMNAAVNVRRPGQTPVPVQMMLEPGRCQPLGTEVIGAEPASCQAFAKRAPGAQLANQKSPE